MNAGSIVVVKPLPYELLIAEMLGFIDWLPIDDEQTQYMLDCIIPCPNCGRHKVVRFADGPLGFCNEGEIFLDLKYVREVEPPLDMDNLMKECDTKPAVKQVKTLQPELV